MEWQNNCRAYFGDRYGACTGKLCLESITKSFVVVQGFCYDGCFFILVYEFIAGLKASDKKQKNKKQKPTRKE